MVHKCLKICLSNFVEENVNLQKIQIYGQSKKFIYFQCYYTILQEVLKALIQNKIMQWFEDLR